MVLDVESLISTAEVLNDAVNWRHFEVLESLQDPGLTVISIIGSEITGRNSYHNHIRLMTSIVPEVKLEVYESNGHIYAERTGIVIASYKLKIDGEEIAKYRVSLTFAADPKVQQWILVSAHHSPIEGAEKVMEIVNERLSSASKRT